MTDAVDPDFVSIEDLDDLRIFDADTANEHCKYNAACWGSIVDDDITDIVDYEMVPEDDFDIDVDLDDDSDFISIEDALQDLRNDDEFIPDILRDLPEDDFNILDDAAEAADEAYRAAENVRIQEATSFTSSHKH